MKEASLKNKNQHKDDFRKAMLYRDGCIFICDEDNAVFPEGLPEELRTDEIVASVRT